MGFIFSRVWTRLLAKKNVRVLMVGLDAAGKTSLLYQLKMGELVKTIPTIGFNVESVDYKGLKITIWDIGGQDKLRVLWKHYYEGSDAIIFVVDSADTERISLAQETMQKVSSSEELQNAAILIMANKQDINGAVSATEIADKFCLSKMKNRKWRVQGTSATTGIGIKEGMDWLANVLLKCSS